MKALVNKVIIRLQIFCLVIVCALPICAPAQGTSGTPQNNGTSQNAGGTTSQGTSTQPTVENKSDGNALRFTVINAITNFVNNSREATYNIEWELLPVTKPLLEMAASIEPKRFVIQNPDLNNAQWINKIKDPNDQLALAQALGISNLNDMRQPLTKDTYADILLNSPFGLTSNEIIAGLLDHYTLRFILSSNGIGYSTNVSDAQVLGPNPQRFDKEIRWIILLYPVQHLNVQQGNPFTLYRVSIKSELSRSQTLTFPNTTQDTATLVISASFKPSPNTIGVQQQFAEVSKAINLSQVQQISPQSDQPQLGGTTIEGILKFVGNVDLSDVVGYGLFRGNARSRLFYGGLIGQGRIQQAIGVNQLFSAKGTSGWGWLLGVVPGSNNSLMAGPSYQTDAITGSIGIMAREKDKANSSDKTITIGPAGALSIDLSNVFGGKKNVQPIKLENSVIGGRSSDVIASILYGVRVSITPDSSLTPDDENKLSGTFVIFRRTASFGDDGMTPIPIDPNKQEKIPVRIQTRLFKSTMPQGIVSFTIPRGVYVIDRGTLPNEFSLVDAVTRAPIQNNIQIPIGNQGQEGVLSFSYLVVKAPK